MRCAIFPIYVSKVRLPRKIDARSYAVLHLSRKIIFPKLKIWCSKMQPISGNQSPDLLTSLMNQSLVVRLPWNMSLGRSSANVPGLPSFLEMLQNPHVLLTFGKVQNPLRLPRKTTSERSKVIRACGVFNIFASAFLHLHFLSSDSFSSLIFSLLLFSSLTLITSAFPSVHIVGSLTFKFPSISSFLVGCGSAIDNCAGLPGTCWNPWRLTSWPPSDFRPKANRGPDCEAGRGEASGRSAWEVEICLWALRKYLINRASTHYTYSMFFWNIECKHFRRVISWDWRTLTQDAPRVCQVKPLLHIWQSWSMNLKVGVQPGFCWLETYFRAPRNFTRPWVLSDNVWKHSSMFKAAFPVIRNWQ